MVQTLIFRDPSLPAHVKLVYTCLVTYADHRRVAFPSQQTIARDTGISVRAVGKAIKQAQGAGLISVTHTQGSNRYLLHDLKVGGYIPGSGPVSTTCRSDQHDTPARPAPDANELDHLSRPSVQTSTSSDAFAAVGQRTSSQTARKIFLPRDFKRWDDNGRVAQYLVSAALATMQEAGLDPHERAADAMGRKLADLVLEIPRDEVVDIVRDWVKYAGTDHDGVGWLATPVRRTA